MRTTSRSGRRTGALLVACCLLLLLAGCTSDGPSETPTVEPPHELETPPTTQETTTTDSNTDERTITYALTIGSVVQPNYTQTARSAIESWEESPDGAEINFQYTTAAEQADLHITFAGVLTECNGERAESVWYYCTLDNSTNDHTSVVVSGIYTKRDMGRILRTVSGQYIGYEMRSDSLLAEPPQYLDPWPTKSDVVVNLSVEVDSTRAWEPIVAETLAYWDSAEHEYGNYTESFVFRPDAAEADVTVSIVENVSNCGHETGNLLGCANLYGPNVLAEPVTDVRIEAGYTNETTVAIMKHEFGHVYGRNHGQQPTGVMSERIVNATRVPKLDAVNRTNPFGENPITVFVDYESFERPNEDIRFQVQKTVEYYDNGSAPQVATTLNVTLTRNRSTAEIVVQSGEIQHCQTRGGPASCGIFYGRNDDSDTNFEVFTRQNITLHEIDTETIGWHVGYWMGFTVGGATDRNDLPAPFKDATYEQRTNWWR